MAAVPLQVVVLVQAVLEVVVLVVGAAVDLGVQGDHCLLSSPSAHLGAAAGVLAEELALVAVLAPAVLAPAVLAPAVQAPAVQAQVALAPAALAQVALAPAALAQVALAPAALAQVALAQVMVRHHRHRQRNQTQPQSRLQAIWIATKSQTLEMVRSDPALNQLG